MFSVIKIKMLMILMVKAMLAIKMILVKMIMNMVMMMILINFQKQLFARKSHGNICSGVAFFRKVLKLESK